jgi:hypothetical protein
MTEIRMISFCSEYSENNFQRLTRKCVSKFSVSPLLEN